MVSIVHKGFIYETVDPSEPCRSNEGHDVEVIVFTTDYEPSWAGCQNCGRRAHIAKTPLHASEPEWECPSCGGPAGGHTEYCLGGPSTPDRP